MYLLLLFGTASKEFIHLFADHHDTVHIDHEGEGPFFESEHHHCDFLNYSLPEFDNDISFPFVAFAEREAYTEYQLHKVRFVQREIIQTSLRGPPAVTA
jgi:hypothetical protein